MTLGRLYTGPGEDDPGDEAAAAREEREEQRERKERSARRDRVSWTIVGWVMAAALPLLSYDSGGAALDAHRSGRPWLYPACVCAACLLGFVILAFRWVRRLRERSSDRGPA